MQDLNELIGELLARELRPNTREDLGVFRQQLAAGTLAPEDARYIRALHERVVGGGAPKLPKAQREKPEPAAPPSEVERLRAEVAALRQREAALVAERDELQKTIGDLRQELDALRSASKG